MGGSLPHNSKVTRKRKPHKSSRRKFQGFPLNMSDRSTEKEVDDLTQCNEVQDEHKSSAPEEVHEKLVNLPLLKIITQIRTVFKDEDHKKKVISELDKSVYSTIYHEIYRQKPLGEDSLNNAIMWESIIQLLVLWGKYWKPRSNDRILDVYTDLRKYLRLNLDYVKRKQNLILDDMKTVCENEKEEESLHIECSYKKLKTLFYYDIHKTSHTLINKCINPIIVKEMNNLMSSKEIVNWPGFSVRIMLPHFEIQRTSVDNTLYKLLKLLPESNNKPQLEYIDCDLKRTPIPDAKTCETFKSSIIISYLKQVKHAIRINTTLSVTKKLDMISILNEFETDVKLCQENIESFTDYEVSLSKYPYIRFLGQPLDGVMTQPHIGFEDQKHVEPESLNVRLREITYPALKFSLQKFNPSYDKDSSQNDLKFTLDENILFDTKKGWILYHCLACNQQFQGIFALNDITCHLNSEHGSEPNWACSRCDFEMETKKLSTVRWHHKCFHSPDEP